MSKKEITQHVTAAGDELRAAADIALDDARDTQRRLRIVARETGEKVQDYIAHKKEQAHDVRVKAESTIKARPFATTAAAFLGGLLLGRLLRRD
ncbi:MAG: hypothetical protein WDN72_04425 [Alphaproteobacteria bacterium]